MQKNEHINITNKTKCRISFFFIYYLSISLSTLLPFSLILLNKLVKCQTTFGNTVQIPVTILLQETSWTVLSPHPHLSLSLRHDLHLFMYFFRACCNSKSFLLEPPAASVLSESFLCAQKKKSVQTSSQLASSC